MLLLKSLFPLVSCAAAQHACLSDYNLGRIQVHADASSSAKRTKCNFVLQQIQLLVQNVFARITDLFTEQKHCIGTQPRRNAWHWLPADTDPGY